MRELLSRRDFFFFFAEREVSPRMVSVHHSKEESETIFKLLSEGTF